MSKKITVKRSEEKELAEKVVLLTGLDERVLNERVSILDQALPPRKDVVLYLSTIDGLSRELNLGFGGISLSPGEVTEATGAAVAAKATKGNAVGLQILETDLDFTGSKENIYTFLRLLEESAPLMQIKDIKISRLGSENYALSLRLGMLYAVTEVNQIKGQITLFDQTEENYFKLLEGFRKFSALSEVGVQDTGLGKTNLFEVFTPQL